VLDFFAAVVVRVGAIDGEIDVIAFRVPAVTAFVRAVGSWVKFRASFAERVAIR